jgi:hypothetical protein
MAKAQSRWKIEMMQLKAIEAQGPTKSKERRDRKTARANARRGRIPLVVCQCGRRGGTLLKANDKRGSEARYAHAECM